jgi:hypothetical protein
MIAEFLSRTPVWVWGILLGLLALGWWQSRPRLVGRGRLFLVPGLMLGLSLLALAGAFGMRIVPGSAWAVGVLLALGLGRLLKAPVGVNYHPEERAFAIPGSWAPLGLMLAIFVVRYAVSASLAVSPGLVDSAPLGLAAGAAYGFLGGLFLARALGVAACVRG